MNVFLGMFVSKEERAARVFLAVGGEDKPGDKSRLRKVQDCRSRRSEKGGGTRGGGGGGRRESGGGGDACSMQAAAAASSTQTSKHRTRHTLAGDAAA